MAFVCGAVEFDIICHTIQGKVTKEIANIIGIIHA
jgi:DNA-binding CsgD family transcriptional regulator